MNCALARQLRLFKRYSADTLWLRAIEVPQQKRSFINKSIVLMKLRWANLPQDGRKYPLQAFAAPGQ
jgi:hypothetical protein